MWLYLAILSYFLNAFVLVIHKLFLNKSIANPIAYAFFDGMLSFLVLLFIPLGFSFLPLSLAVLCLINGLIFFIAFFMLLKSLSKGDVSMVVPITGAFTPIFILISSYYVMDEVLPVKVYISFILLVVGGILIAVQKPQRVFKKRIWFRKGFWLAVASSFFYGLAYTFTKYIFLNTGFWNGFIWIRMGNLLGALSLLLFSYNRKKIFATSKKVGQAVSFLFIGNKVLAAGGFLILNYSIFLGSAALVNSLQGVQYVFVFLISIYLSYKFPKMLKEEIHREILLQKVISIALICAGIFLLV